MNKKGFTLVELLAVIAILAILVIIALPNVLGMFNNAKRNAFSTEVKTIYKQAGTDFISDSLKETGPRYYCDEAKGNMSGKSPDNCKNLNLTTTKKYYVEMDSNGNVTYIGVKDESFTYGGGNVTSVNSISDNDILDSSKNTTFSIYDKNTSSEGVHDGETTDNRATYTVVHLQQKVIEIPSGSEEDDGYYRIADTSTLSSVIGNTVTPATKTYTGFTSPSTKSAIVNADGSTTIKYYYSRNRYTITIDSDSCTGTSGEYYDDSYGEPVQNGDGIVVSTTTPHAFTNRCPADYTSGHHYTQSFYYNQRVKLSFTGATIYVDGIYVGTGSYSFNMPAKNFLLTYEVP